MVFIEAAAAGVAQVAGRSGGSHEAVRDGVTGLVVDHAGSDGALARAMEALLGDRERREEFARTARAVACADSDWRVLAQRLSIGLAPYDQGRTTSIS